MSVRLSINLSSEAERVRSLDEEIATLERHLSDLKKRRNSHVPINHLPNELLQAIFCIVHSWDTDQLPKSTWSAPKIIYGAAKVCARWEHAVNSCSQIWSTIDLAYAPGFVRGMLTLAGTLPLSVHCGGYYVSCDRSMQHVANAAARVRSLHIAEHDERAGDLRTAGMVIWALSAGFHDLVTLELSCHVDAKANREPPHSSFLPLPHLRSLTLTNIHPRYFAPWQLPSLAHLSVTGISYLHGSPLELWAAAEGCTSLQSLDLQSIASLPLAPDAPEIRFASPALRDVRIYHAAPAWVSSLLARIAPPPACTLHAAFAATPAPTPLAALAPGVRALMERRSWFVSHLRIDVHADRIQISPGTDGTEGRLILSKHYSSDHEDVDSDWTRIQSIAKSLWAVYPTDYVGSASIAVHAPGQEIAEVITLRADANDEGWSSERALEELFSSVPAESRLPFAKAENEG